MNLELMMTCSKGPAKDKQFYFIHGKVTSRGTLSVTAKLVEWSSEANDNVELKVTTISGLSFSNWLGQRHKEGWKLVVV